MYYPKNNFSAEHELKRPNRHAGAMSRRVSPNIYNTVFNNPSSPRAMPPQGFVRTRGAAHVPTEGHWADPPLASFAPSLPAQAAADDEYRIKLIEAQLRSEERMRRATIALATDKMEAAAKSGSLTARF